MCFLCNCSGYSGPSWNKFEWLARLLEKEFYFILFLSDFSPLIDIWKWERNTTRSYSHNNRSWNCNKPKCSTYYWVNRRGTTEGLLVGWTKPTVQRSHRCRHSRAGSAPPAEPGDDAWPAQYHHLSFQHSLSALSTSFGWVLCCCILLQNTSLPHKPVFSQAPFFQICPETVQLLPLLHSSFLQVQ